jgi:hypothetical protein
MTSSLKFQTVAILAVGALASPAFARGLTVPPVPTNIQVPAGNTVFLEAQAAGTQNYICQTSASASSGFSWTLFGPQATLFVTFRVGRHKIPQQVATHFLSSNPQEGGTARPTWQSSLDTSAVWGRAIASSSDAAFVVPGAIPWLLVAVVGARTEPTGGNFLTQTTYIQRLNTSGGLPPSTGCSQSTDVGSTVLVPYNADYFFYRTSR